MGRGWMVNASELDDLLKKLDKAGADMDRIAHAAIHAAFPIVRTEMAQQMPRSAQPRRSTLKEPWRTGVHASDFTLYMRPKFRINLRRTAVYALVGPDKLPPYATSKTAINKAGRHFYMWHVVRGRELPNGTYLRGQPYVRRVSRTVRQQVSNAMKDIFIKEMDLFD